MGNKSSNTASDPIPANVVQPVVILHSVGDLVSYLIGEERYLAEVMEIDNKDNRIQLRTKRLHPEAPYWVTYPNGRIGKADFNNTTNLERQDRDKLMREQAAQSNIQCHCDPGFQCICLLIARPPVPTAPKSD